MNKEQYQCGSEGRIPILSVIIPVYNVENYIELCARSLFEQTLKNIEYIFVDDRSLDSSVDVLHRVIEDYPERKEDIKIISNEKNLGPSATRNIGLNICSGDYITFCDSDDEVEKNAYELMINKALETESEIISCGTYVDDGDVSYVLSFNDSQSLSYNSLYKLECIEGVLWSSLWNKVMHRNLLVNNNVRFHDSLKMWDDLYFTFIARYFCKKDALVNMPLYHYKFKQTGSLTSENKVIKATSQIECVRELERFLQQQENGKKMMTVLSFLKMRAKDGLFTSETISKWKKIYPEAHKKIHLFYRYYGLSRIVCYYSVIFFGKYGWRIKDFLSLLKKRLLKNEK